MPQRIPFLGFAPPSPQSAMQGAGQLTDYYARQRELADAREMEAAIAEYNNRQARARQMSAAGIQGAQTFAQMGQRRQEFDATLEQRRQELIQRQQQPFQFSKGVQERAVATGQAPGAVVRADIAARTAETERERKEREARERKAEATRRKEVATAKRAQEKLVRDMAEKRATLIEAGQKAGRERLNKMIVAFDKGGVDRQMVMDEVENDRDLRHAIRTEAPSPAARVDPATGKAAIFGEEIIDFGILGDALEKVEATERLQRRDISTARKPSRRFDPSRQTATRGEQGIRNRSISELVAAGMPLTRGNITAAMAQLRGQ